MESQMKQNEIEDVGKTLQSAYDEYYDDSLSGWRETGAKVKAENIESVCRGQSYEKVLECGAGEGSILKFLSDSNFCNELYALEISDSGITQIKKRDLDKLKEVKKFNGYVIPYPDDYFDLVYCSHVIEHVEHPRVLLRELQRISQNQVFEIPLDYSPKVDRYMNDYLKIGHINVYTPSTFRFLLKSEGFEIKDELLCHLSNDVIRYNWYNNQDLKKTIFKEMNLLIIHPLLRLMNRLRYGRNYSEFGYQTYTCFTNNSKGFKALQKDLD